MMKLGILDRFLKKTFFVFLLFFPFSSIFGAERILVPNHSRVERYISRESLTQIKVEYSRIRNVFGDENRFSYQYSDIDGSLFIKPISSFSNSLVFSSSMINSEQNGHVKQSNQSKENKQNKENRRVIQTNKENRKINDFFQPISQPIHLAQPNHYIDNYDENDKGGESEKDKKSKISDKNKRTDEEKNEEDGKNKINEEQEKGQKNQKNQTKQIKLEKYGNRELPSTLEGEIKTQRGFQTVQDKSFTLSIVTEEGRSYILVLTPKDKLPDTLLLIPKEGRSKQAKILKAEAEYEEGLIELFRLMYLDQIPYGYSVEIISGKSSNLNKLSNLNRPRKLNDYLEYQLDKIYRGAELKGEVYTIKNIFSDDLTVSEQMFITPGTRAVSLEKEAIPFGQTIRLFKVLNNE